MKIKGYDIAPKSIVNIVFGILERVFSYRYFNVWKTIYINFRLLPLHQAIKLPITIWGGVKICSLMGRIHIQSQVKQGMIQLGSRKRVELASCNSRSVIYIDGDIIFKGECNILNGYFININKGATVVFGVNIATNSNLTIIAKDDVFIGDYSRFAFGVRIMTNDIHYSIDTTVRKVQRNRSTITIGAHNWITADVKIMKGTVTPDWTIIMSGSVLNKDYTVVVPERSIIGGSPAKLIKEGQCRVFSVENEMYLNRYFEDNRSSKYFVLPDNVNILEFCKR